MSNIDQADVNKTIISSSRNNYHQTIGSFKLEKTDHHHLNKKTRGKTIVLCQ